MTTGAGGQVQGAGWGQVTRAVGSVRARLVVALLVAVLVTAGATEAGAARSGGAPEVGVTGSTVTVAGLVGADAGATGADVGAKARFARANRQGGVRGRTVEYSGNAADVASATKTFAVVPAVGDALDTAALAQARAPFFGAASTIGWDANRFGFGFAGAQVTRQTNRVSPAWGMQLRSLLGTAQGSQVALATDAGELGAARAEQARASLRAAGFQVSTPVTVPAPPAALPDLAPVAATLATGAPAVVMLLTSPVATTGIAQQLARLAFVGTVAADASMYRPATPAVANGLTVLVPYAAPEQATTANRRLAADVEALAPGTALTPGVVAGYWSADLFLSLLHETGRQLTRERLLAAGRGFTHGVTATAGPVRFPAVHSEGVPCGALLQSDGSRYFVAEAYRCGKVLTGSARTGTSGTATTRS